MKDFKTLYPVCGVRPSPVDERDYPLNQLIPRAPKLPRQYKSEYGQKIMDQKDVGACVSYSSALSRGIQEAATHDGKFEEFAPMYIYGNRFGDRDANGKPQKVDSEGSGLYPRNALKILKNYGICKKEYFDFLAEYPECCNRYKANYSELDKHAYPYRISSYYRIKNKMEAMVAIYELKAILLCVPVYESLYFPDPKTGFVKYVPNQELMGYHCMTGVGFDVDKQAFLVANSWSEDYGLNGYIWLDFSYVPSEMWAMVDDIQTVEVNNKYKGTILDKIKTRIWPM